MARTTTRHAILVESALRISPQRLEAVGSGVIYPGQLLYMVTATQVDQHATASGASAKFISLVNPAPDTYTYPTTAAIDIPYADGDTVQFMQGLPGDVVNMKIASGQSVTKGKHWLISDGNGNLKSCGTGLSVGTSCPIGIAWQTVNANGGTAARCLVRIV